MKISTAYLLANSGQSINNNILDDDLRTWLHTGSWFIYDSIIDGSGSDGSVSADATSKITYDSGTNRIWFTIQETDVRVVRKAVYKSISVKKNTDYIFSVTAQAVTVQNKAGDQSALREEGTGRKAFLAVGDTSQTTLTSITSNIAVSETLETDIFGDWRTFKVNFNSGDNADIRCFIDLTEFKGRAVDRTVYTGIYIKSISLREV